MEKEPNEGQRRSPHSPGGRALERLHQFEQERGFEPTRAVPGEPDEGPRDQTESRTRSAGGRAVRGVPGGKALARLHHFELARGLKHTDIQNTESVKGFTGVVSPPQNATAKEGLPGAGMQAPVESPYLTAMEQVERAILEDPTVRAQPTWSPLGPFSVPQGQTYGSGPGSRPSISGRLSSIAIDPGDPSHILIGSAAGGVWETKDGGDSWHPRTDDQKTLTIGAVAFDPGDPSIAYAGTGEGNARWRLGTGLLRSADGGTTWTEHATTHFVGLGFHALVVDPLDT